MRKTIGKAVCLPAAGAVVGILLLTLAYALPVNPGSAHVQESLWILDTEGWYPSLPLVKAYDGVIQAINSGGTIDNYTDALMVRTAAADHGGNPFLQAVKMASSQYPDGYSYYWHGYVTLLRPLLMVMDYGEIRVLNQMLQLALVVCMAVILFRRKGLPWAFLALSIYLLLMPMTLALCLQYSWVFYIGMLGALLVIRFDCFREEKNFWLLLCGLGILTSYFDLLTYPLFTWGIPVLWWIVMDRGERGDFRRVLSVAAGGLFWIGGYAGMWILKWLLGEIVLGGGLLAAALYEVTYRAGVAAEAEGRELSRWAPVVSNWRLYESVQTVSLLAAWYVWLGIRIWKRKAFPGTGKCFSLLLTALSSVVWYLILHNHTLIHYFTYRIYNISFAALLAMMILAVEGEAESGSAPVYAGRGKAIAGLAPVVLFLSSVLIASLDRETFWIHNGGNEFEWTGLKEGQVLEQQLLPSYSRVKMFQIGLWARGEGQGEFELRLLRDGQELYRTEISAADAAEEGFYDIPTEWKLTAGECYTLYLTTKGMENTEGFVGITKDGALPLPECPRTVLDGENVNGQLMCGFVYEGHPNAKRQLLDLFTCMGVLFAFYLCGLQALHGRNGDGKGELADEKMDAGH